MRADSTKNAKARPPRRRATSDSSTDMSNDLAPTTAPPGLDQSFPPNIRLTSAAPSKKRKSGTESEQDDESDNESDDEELMGQVDSNADNDADRDADSEADRDQEHLDKRKKLTHSQEVAQPGYVKLNPDQMAMLRAGLKAAMAQLIKDHQLAQLQTQLDAIAMLHGYLALHDQDPNQLSEKTKSPYTHNTSMAFFNLAQSKIHGVGAYTGGNDTVAAYLTHLIKSGITDGDILNLLLQPTFTAFNKLFATIVEDLDESESEVLRQEMWALVQLWHLEGARRLGSGGAMNAVAAVNAAELDEPDAREVITKNTMSAEGASGKSEPKSEGKYFRMKRVREIINLLVERGTGNPFLAKVLRSVIAFADVVTEDMENDEDDDEDEGEDSAKKAAAAWRKAGGFGRFRMKVGVTLSLSRKLKASQPIQRLKSLAEYKAMVDAFTDFMNAYYDGTHSDATLDKRVLGQDPAIDDPFVVWLINKAASEGHKAVLAKMIPKPDKDEHEDEHKDMDEESPLSAFAQNQDPQTASSVRHVGNLRSAYEEAPEESPLDKVAINANRHSQHVDTRLGAYDRISDDIVLRLAAMARRTLGATEDPAPETQKAVAVAVQWVQAAMQAGSLAAYQFEEEKLLALHAAYVEKYQHQVDILTAWAKSTEGKDWGVEIKVLTVGERSFAPVREAKLARMAIPTPDQVRSAIDLLRALWRVYHGIETARDPEAGALNLITRQFGRKTGQGEPFTPQELYQTLNIMSPEGVAADQQLKNQQYAAVRQQVFYARELVATLNKLISVRDESGAESEQYQLAYQAFTEGLKAELNRQLNASGGAVVKAESAEAARVRVAQEFVIGTASAEGLNCLIDSLLQLRDGPGSTSAQQVEQVRSTLHEVYPGLRRGTMLDFYGTEGQDLVTEIAGGHFQVQVIQIRGDGTEVHHPPVGTGPAIRYLLHQGNHFEPMWRR